MAENEDSAFSSWGDVEAALKDCRRIARNLLRHEQDQYSWQTTALLDAALLRMYPSGQWHEVTWNDRRHFLNACRKAMKSAITDRHRRAAADKRPAEVSIELFQEALSSSTPDILTEYDLYWSLEQATTRISQTDPELAEILELRFLIKLSVPEIAKLLDRSERHMRRLWAEAVRKLEDVIRNNNCAE